MSPRGSAPRRVLVWGGTSEIGLAIADALCREGAEHILLAGRDTAGLEAAAERLRGAGAGRVDTLAVDARDTDAHPAAVDEAFARLGGVDVVVLAVGILGERGGLPDDVAGALEVLEVNSVGAGSLLMLSAGHLRRQGAGTIVVLSSVAAERPRRANAVYGASKAALDALAQAIGDDIRQSGARVLVVRPGFVHTRMTRGLPVPPASATTAQVAAATVHGLRTGAHTVWAPARLRLVMALLRLLPRPLFRRLSM